MRKLAACSVLALVLAVPAGAAISTPRSLDGSGNNLAHPDWGKAGLPYLRVAPANYAADGNTPIDGPNARYISNRIFNDLGQNIFSENGLSQLDWVWGQFMDHTIGLRDQTAAGDISIPFNSSAVDPLEAFTSNFPIGVSRSPAAPTSGATRQQTNTVNSYISAWNVYGGTLDRQEWIRDGLYDGNMANNDAQLVLINGYLPRESARGVDPMIAPQMDLMGALTGHPEKAVVSGDVRANENIALTAMHTLFAREHNRIASSVPQVLSEETRFQIARRVVGAEEQFITYNEFLPAMGVDLPAYTGYKSNVNATLSNEFATVGFRAHSQIHGVMEPVAPVGRYSDALLQRLQKQGVTVSSPTPDQVKLTIPLSLAFGNPDLLQQVGIGPLLRGLAGERQYRNDEQIDNQLRSILFQIPKKGSDPAVCIEKPDPKCFSAVVDLGAIDIQRARDHGMPLYNDMRAAYGLTANTTFEEITGEPASPPINPNDPAILDFQQLFDANGLPVPLGDAANAVVGVRRTTLASRLRAIYGSPGGVDNVNGVDAFVGMVSEQHVAGADFGELQLAIWTKQFLALRDGDRFFYGNDPYLTTIKNRYGIDFHHTLAEIINMNTSAGVQAAAFKSQGDGD